METQDSPKTLRLSWGMASPPSTPFCEPLSATTMPYLGCLLMKLFLWHSFLLLTTWMLIHISGFVLRFLFAGHLYLPIDICSCLSQIWSKTVSSPDTDFLVLTSNISISCPSGIQWQEERPGCELLHQLTYGIKILRWNLAKLLLPCFQS